jgi:ankyrin repeat protein
MLAAKNGDTAVVRALLAGGARVNDAQHPCGLTALHFAAASGHIDAIHALVAADADINNTTRDTSRTVGTMSPLLLATLADNVAAVKALLELGADSGAVYDILQRFPGHGANNGARAIREVIERHHAGGHISPARVCALPSCDARRRADYDVTKLQKCGCRRVSYCCKDHQRAHWPHHKADCKAHQAACDATAPAQPET